MSADYGIRTISGQIIATDISAEEYMERYAADFCEWVEGIVIKMSPETLRHDPLIYYVRNLLDVYFTLRPIGKVLDAPFVMRSHPRLPRREPDSQVILNTNSGVLTDTFMDGPADVCIEIVSPDSVDRDYTEKPPEYQKGGVREYWILDPLENKTRFYRLNDVGVYVLYSEDAEGNYRTPLLQDLEFHVPTLWQLRLPDPIAVVEAVKAMLVK
jgi:Uma2 family endonuclease